MDMDLSAMWLTQLEIDDQGFMNQYEKMNKPYDAVDILTADPLSPESYTETEAFVDKCLLTPTRFEEQTEMKLPSYPKAAISINNTMSQTLQIPAPGATLPFSNTFTISFGDQNPKNLNPSYDDWLGNETGCSGKVQATGRTPPQAQDHVLAERKRREKLNSHFISLSALLPNLKKMDKAPVLEDATNYIRELQERVKELEGLSDVKRKDAKESDIALKKSTLRSDDDNGSSSYDTNSADSRGDMTRKTSAEIEVRMSGSSVLVRIQSQKNSSLLMKVLSKMQKLGLSITSSSTMPFANNSTLIVVVAQIDGDFFMTATDLVKNLQLTL